MVDQFKEYLISNGKSINTVNSYGQHVKGYIKWFENNKQLIFNKIYEENVREYVQHLQNINQKPTTINAKVNALHSFNEYLVECGAQSNTFNTKGVFMKVQQQYASLAKVTKDDVEMFRQMVLESGNIRNYTLVTLLAYAGLRISEALNLTIDDISIGTREITVTGKGNKTRVVLMNNKVKIALEKYLENRDSNNKSNYLFYSRQNEKLNRTTVNNIFKKITHRTTNSGNNFPEFSNLKKFPNFQESDVPLQITPHDLRHFYCSHAISIGMDINEVANQAGHSNIQTTLLYANPTKEEMLSKIDKM